MLIAHRASGQGHNRDVAGDLLRQGVRRLIAATRK
jgi:hypothetical protein